MSGSRTAIHAIIGALVAVLLSFLPFSTLLGGAVSGFLEGPDGGDGALVGGLSGAITFLPIAAVAFALVSFFGIGFGLGGLPTVGFVFLVVLFGIAVATLLVYTVGFAALGGFLGAYIAREYPDHRRKTRDAIGFDSSERPYGSRPTRERDRRMPRDDPVATDEIAREGIDPDGRDADVSDPDTGDRADR